MPLNNGLRKKTQNRFNKIYFLPHYTTKIEGWFTLDKIKLELLATGDSHLVFEWPTEYLDAFDFELLVSPDSSEGSFSGEDGLVRVDLDADLASPRKNFFIMRARLAN